MYLLTYPFPILRPFSYSWFLTSHNDLLSYFPISLLVHYLLHWDTIRIPVNNIIRVILPSHLPVVYSVTCRIFHLSWSVSLLLTCESHLPYLSAPSFSLYRHCLVHTFPPYYHPPPHLRSFQFPFSCVPIKTGKTVQEEVVTWVPNVPPRKEELIYKVI